MALVGTAERYFKTSFEKIAADDRRPSQNVVSGVVEMFFRDGVTCGSVLKQDSPLGMQYHNSPSVRRGQSVAKRSQTSASQVMIVVLFSLGV